MIDSKCKECKTYLPVDSADAMVLHAVTQKYKQRCKPGYEHQRCHDGQDLRVLPLQGRKTLHPLLPFEMQPVVPDDGGCHKEGDDHVNDHINRKSDSYEVGSCSGLHLNPGGQYQDGENQQGPVTESGLRILFHKLPLSRLC